MLQNEKSGGVNLFTNQPLFLFWNVVVDNQLRANKNIWRQTPEAEVSVGRFWCRFFLKAAMRRMDSEQLKVLLNIIAHARDKTIYSLDC